MARRNDRLVIKLTQGTQIGMGGRIQAPDDCTEPAGLDLSEPLPSNMGSSVMDQYIEPIKFSLILILILI